MLGTARFGYAATLLADGSVLITGGEDSGGNTLQSTELFTPGANPATTGAFSAGTPTLNHARFQHTATLLPNGKILLAGGDAGGDAELVRVAKESCFTHSALAQPVPVETTLSLNGQAVG